jgi:DNA-binding beta-propeller fold protein YncE
MAYNQSSGLLYITNEESNNVSLIQNETLIGHIPTGKWPKFVASDPHSDRVYVSHVWNGIMVMRGSNITAKIPGYIESYWPLINTVNGYVYFTDLGEVVTIVKDDKRVKDVPNPDFEGNEIKWQLTSDFDELTGLTYFASWQNGALTVYDGLEVIDQYSFDGEGANDMVIDSHRRMAIIANKRAKADEASPNNVSIVNIDTKSVSQIFSAKQSEQVALDKGAGYMYVTNPDDGTVTVLRGRGVVANYETGDHPHAVAVDSVRGLAYITDIDDNTVTVFRDGEILTTILLPEEKGFEPTHVTIDEVTGRLFVLNRSSKEKPTYPDREVTICKEAWVHIFE